MADTNFRGPVNNMGSLELQSGTAATVETFDGPMGSYQGVGYLDPRYLFAKDTMLPGAAPAFMMNPAFVTVDGVPQAASTSILAAAQSAVPSQAFSLATVGLTVGSAGQAAIAVGIPLIPQGTTAVQTVIALDFGFTTGTTAANSSTVTVGDSSLFQLGGWYVFGNCANVGATASLIAQVRSVPTSTTITINPTPATAINAPIGGANLWGSGLLPIATQFGPANASATAVSKTILAGMQRIHNPREMLARCLSVTASTATGGTTTVLCTGYDVWGQQMTELLTASGTTTIYGKKGFKYLSTAVSQATGIANYTLGIGDVFSFPLRSDEVDQTLIKAGGTTMTNAVGYTAGVVTAATNTTGDVRGTIQVSALGGGTSISSAATTNNVLRFTFVQMPSVQALVTTTPNNLTPMFGTTQA